MVNRRHRMQKPAIVQTTRRMEVDVCPNAMKLQTDCNKRSVNETLKNIAG